MKIARGRIMGKRRQHEMRRRARQTKQTHADRLGGTKLQRAGRRKLAHWFRKARWRRGQPYPNKTGLGALFNPLYGLYGSD